MNFAFGNYVCSGKTSFINCLLNEVRLIAINKEILPTLNRENTKRNRNI